MKMTLAHRFLLTTIAALIATPALAQDTRAAFEVTKDFVDDSTMDVAVTLRCNHGLPLRQTYYLLNEGYPVTFVVTTFQTGELRCEVTEEVPPGYEASYDDGSVSPTDCFWSDVEDGDELSCHITNSLVDPRARFRVRKHFTDGNPGPAEVQLRCNTGLPLSQSFNLSNGSEVVFVVADFDSGELSCEVTETVPPGYWASYNDGTPSRLDCSWSRLPHGADVSCMITNTPLRPDRDDDGVPDDEDNCPDDSNQGQFDFDGDGIGDACDSDIDGDSVSNETDLCPASQGPKLVDPDTGCSLAQLCPCEGPMGEERPWEKQKDYLKCIKENARHLRKLGVIGKAEYKFLLEEAKASQCGA